VLGRKLPAAVSESGSSCNQKSLAFSKAFFG